MELCIYVSRQDCSDICSPYRCTGRIDNNNTGHIRFVSLLYESLCCVEQKDMCSLYVQRAPKAQKEHGPTVNRTRVKRATSACDTSTLYSLYWLMSDPKKLQLYPSFKRRASDPVEHQTRNAKDHAPNAKSDREVGADDVCVSNRP